MEASSYVQSIRSRLGQKKAPSGQQEGVLDNVLIVVGFMIMSFGAFIGFVWAAIDLSGVEETIPDSFDEAWLVPVLMMVVSFAIAAVPLVRRRSRGAAGTCAAALVLFIILLALSPYW